MWGNLSTSSLFSSLSCVLVVCVSLKLYQIWVTMSQSFAPIEICCWNSTILLWDCNEFEVCLLTCEKEQLSKRYKKTHHHSVCILCCFSFCPLGHLVFGLWSSCASLMFCGILWGVWYVANAVHESCSYIDASIISLCCRISRIFLWELECLWGM